MRRIFLILWWSFLVSSGIVALAQYMHPATFAPAIFPALTGLAFLCLMFWGANKRYGCDI